MARQSSRFRLPDTSDKDVERELKREANELAKEFGWPKARAYAVLKKAVEFPELFFPPMHRMWPDEAANLMRECGHWGLEYQSKEKVLRISEEEPLAKLHARVQDMWVSHCSPVEYLTLEERADIVERFADRLQVDRDSLLETGHPSLSIAGYPELDRLAGNYYTRIPKAVKVLVESKHGGDDATTITYTDERFADPRTLFDSTIDMRFEYEWPTEGYKAAAILPILSRPLTVQIERRRDAIHRLKGLVLRTAAVALRKRDAQLLWDRAWDDVKRVLKAEGVRFCCEVDEKYIGGKLGLGPYLPGGLLDLTDFMGECASQIEVGASRRMREALGDLVGLDDNGKPRLVLRHYFEVIDAPERRRFDAAHDLRYQLYREELEFRLKYSDDVIRELRKSFGVEIGGDRHGPLGNELALRGGGADRDGRQRAADVMPFRAGIGTKWSDVKIEFVTEEVVRITVRSKSENRSYVEMGFVNRRVRGGPPNVLWKVLQLLARNNGRIDWKARAGEGQHVRLSLKKHISDLRRTLHAVFPGIHGDAFLDYRKEKAYETAFDLCWNVRD